MTKKSISPKLTLQLRSENRFFLVDDFTTFPPVQIVAWKSTNQRLRQITDEFWPKRLKGCSLPGVQMEVTLTIEEANQIPEVSSAGGVEHDPNHVYVVAHPINPKVTWEISAKKN